MVHNTEYEVLIETTAFIDMRGIFIYITDILKAPQAAERVYQSIQSQLLTLENMPARYNVVSDEPYASMGVRLMPVENYNAFFIISESDHEVHVIRILYNRRDWQSILQINSSDLLS